MFVHQQEIQVPQTGKLEISKAEDWWLKAQNVKGKEMYNVV